MSTFSIQDLAQPAVAFGPAPTAALTPFDMPYTPFVKQDKLGRVADWFTGDDAGKYGGARPGQQQQQRGNQRGRGQQYQQDAPAGAFGFQAAQDEATFATVDATGRTTQSATPVAPLVAPTRGGPGAGGRGGSSARGGRGGGNTRGGDRGTDRGGDRGSDRRGAQGGGDRRGQQGGNARGGYGGGGGYRGGYGGSFAPRVTREPSVPVGDDWAVVAEWDLVRLTKNMQAVHVPPAETLAEYGAVATYGKQFDRVSTKNAVPLAPSNAPKFANVTTMADPVIQELAQKQEANVPDPEDEDDEPVVTVYATDAILAQIMAAPRSVYSWDVVVTCVGDNAVYLDSRPNTIELQSVNENAHEPPTDDKDATNSAANLAVEATTINAYYAQHVVDGKKKVTYGDRAPQFADLSDSEVPSAAFVYRKFILGDALELVVRTELDAVTDVAGTKKTMALRALNQVPGLNSGAGALDWRKALDAQRGAVVATEVRNNANKVARWTLQALLADADVLKIGYVTRAAARDPSKHILMGASMYAPAEFAAQLSLQLENAWGIVETVVQAAVKQPEGKYLLMKDPNKSALKLFALPEAVAGEFACGPNDPFATFDE
ncbi:hypothetical protein AMAG_15432 [Allomyces macrogynus ATCC 38327]|uniref:Eukaryotic translation initiation factor 3 subunit D n=1 Tax=Allomyces macrogynus (strain ATCC 38327) TaxID=578462 RepID=A0A0L0T7G2_ALLM3|nr:hypothetical protein AMAG_15432 [Allomyces macrogynus ATCC 38327]|eukprot:KNE70675.1 hypothetical protein AMAG_15432 [Allomyces macrogynus ATCC 38327]